MADGKSLIEIGSAPLAGKSEKNVAVLVYALQACAFLIGITMLIAVIINYVKREDAAGTWVESHFRWQIRTFWWSLLWFSIGVPLSYVLIGIPIVIASSTRLIYRIIKGWLRLNDGKPMYV